MIYKREIYIDYFSFNILFNNYNYFIKYIYIVHKNEIKLKLKMIINAFYLKFYNY